MAAWGPKGPVAALTQVTHRLSGLAGTIGFPTISARAADLEALVDGASIDAFDALLARDVVQAIQEAFTRDLASPPVWSTPPAVSTARGAKILVAEDESDQRAIVTACLEGAGYVPIAVVSGDLVVTTARAEKPALILLDIAMPRLDGYSACRLLKADPELADIPVIFMTTGANLDDKLAGLALGADEFLSKPVDMRELVLRIQLLIKRSHSRHSPMADEPSASRELTDDAFLAVASEEIARSPAALAIVPLPTERHEEDSLLLTEEIRGRDAIGACGQMSEQTRSSIQRTGTITPQELKESLEEARTRHVSPWDVLSVLIVEKRVSEDALADTFAQWLKLPRVRIASVNVEPEATKAISETLARKHTCLPLKAEGKSLLLAMANPWDYEAIQDVQFASSLMVRPVVASRTEILDGIEAYYVTEGRLQAFVGQVPDATDFRVLTADGEEMDPEKPNTQTTAESSPVVKLCNVILRDSILARASDIHLEPELSAVPVRLRVDGVLRHYMQVPKWLQNAVVSRLKILANLDITERRRPQDGRIKVQLQGRYTDIRVSTLPTLFGEKVVMRLLGSANIPSFQEMGFSDAQSAVAAQVLSQPQGMILVTGPTGSGKSTTLYSMITKRQSVGVNIVTVEDPIEYQVPGINQVQVNAKAGLNFASYLRSILRQDPDVILVGEIRDLETAEITFQAAMTGHLVLSTLHTNGAVATITRLLDLGVNPFLITSAVDLVIAQRLVRRICQQCKEPYIPAREVLETFHMAQGDMVFYHGSGCSACEQTGYAGRVGIYELMRLTPRLKELLTRRATEADMRKMAVLEGTRFLLEDARDKVRQGVTTLDEVSRVIELKDEAIIRCPKCHAFTQQDFSTCPYCLIPLKHLCESCGQELQLEWKICPYCDARSAQEPGAASTQHTLPKAINAELPAVRPGEASPQRGRALRPVQKKLRVLVVDDDDSLQKLVWFALSHLPLAIDILTASDGVEALTIIAQQPPDLVIADVVMPRMDGLTLCQRLREDMRTALVPIMMLTANTDEADRTRGYLVGTDDYVTKPFTVPDLNARVMRLLRRTYGL